MRTSSLATATWLMASLGGSAHAISPPHDPSQQIDCVDCHAVHPDAGEPGLLPTFLEQDVLCLGCHNPTGQAAGMSDVSVHTVGGGSQTMHCAWCHDPHGPQASADPHPGGVTADNLALVRAEMTKFATWAAEPAVFQAPEQLAFGDGQAPWNGVCQSCHQQTTHHTSDATGDHAHGGDYSCTGCHSHADGFAAPLGGCAGCHGDPPVDAGTLVSLPSPTGSQTAGAHALHTEDQGYACDWCHSGSVGAFDTHASGAVTLGFSAFGGDRAGGGYAGQTGVSYDSSEPGTTVSSAGDKTCSGVYCHGELPDGTVWGGGQDTQPIWDGTVTCASCHDEGGAATLLSGNHGAHTDDTTYAFDCEKCHQDTAVGSDQIRDRTLHANNAVELSFAAGGSYDAADGSCASTWCHSDGQGGAPNTPVAWGDAGPLGCASCHDGQTGDAQEMATDGHQRLIGSSWVRQYPCQYCHAATVDASGQLGDYASHVNETVDVAVAPQWNIVGKPAPAYDPATQTCTNVYCHSDGTTVDPEVQAISWTDTTQGCNDCHGHPSGSCDTCHAGDTPEWPPGEEWKAAMPMYTNTGAGSEQANTHMRHLLTDFSCDDCHARTVVNGSCGDCHAEGLPPGSMKETNHIDPEYHVNKVKDVDFKDGGTYDPVTKTCSNTACHLGSDPQWGDSVGDEVLCFTCHGTSGDDVDDFDAFNGTRGLISMPEWYDTGHGRAAVDGAYASGNPPADFPGNPCWYCHANDVLHGDGSNPFRLKHHDQFEQRFDRECVYCHMEGSDAECVGCHDSAESLGPQLDQISGPPDHAPYAGGAQSCVTCHDDDATRHKTGAGLWSALQKDDVKNQYVMMGVCLQCHEDDSNGQCQQCHTGPQYQLGYDPGTGHISGLSKATSTHFGFKHFAAYQSTGEWKGGKFCWDCHDPHGDSNIYMIQDKVATATDGTHGIPTARADVVFTRKKTGLDYVTTSPPHTGLCNVCHVEMGQHYRFDYGDGHNAGRVCTKCHEHRFSDSHSSGQTCDGCHAAKPVPRHTAFSLPRDCTKCHEGVIGDRMDILGQFRANSHHVQGPEVNNRHCYACHWEAIDIGLINVQYHQGFNYKTYETVKDAPVDLVIWGPGVRPTDYQPGTTAVTFTAGKIGTAEERGEVSAVTEHCLGCHSDQNNDVECFGVVDPLADDCKTPNQYAWDGTSIAARYSQTGTVTWGKYTTVAGAAKKDVTKALSAHGNAPANAGGWSPTTGEDDVLPDTRAGTEPVQCFDCHSSHGSKTQGITSSYVTFNGTKNGGNLKETQAGKGGYLVTYKAAGSTSGVNPYNAGAAQCFDCHQTVTPGALPWGYQVTFGASEPIRGYRDGFHFGEGPRGVTGRFAYKADKEVVGGHLKASAPLQFAAKGTIDGLCTPCHDPHGVSPTLGADQQYAVPLLKGTWLTSPYKEDSPIAVVKQGKPGNNPPTPNLHIDQNTFAAGQGIAEDAEQFGGLCLRCHPKSNLTDGLVKNQPWRSLDRIHESVKGWGANTKHSFSCSKCHSPHNSGLGKLLRTNGLDFNHRGRVVSGGSAGIGSKGSFPQGNGYRMQNCHPTPEGWPNNTWNDVTPW